MKQRKKKEKTHPHIRRVDENRLQQQISEAIKLHLSGRLAEAAAIYEQVLAQKPDHADALHLSGVAAHQTGRHETAVRLIEKAIAVTPKIAMFHYNLGAARHAMGQYEEAIGSYRQALALNPDYAEAYSNMGNSYLSLRKTKEAIACHQQAIRLKPDFADAYNNLGTVFNQLRRFEDALSCFQKVLELNPACFEVLHNIGNVYKEESRLSEAAAWYRKALVIHPGHPEVLNNLGYVLQTQGKIPEAVVCFETAVQNKPDYAAAHSNRLFALNNIDHKNQDFLFQQHLAWDAQHGSGKKHASNSFSFSSDVVEKIHIGYVSPDFREHSVAYFIEPILMSHDRSRFSVTCYSDVPYPDDVTLRLKNLGWQWRDTFGVSDAQMFEQIRGDRIHILVDLAGHTANNRLTLFAQKPAPVQVSYIGYPNTTGLQAMDYRITDAIADPPGLTDHLYMEKLIRLPGSFLCYRPSPDAPDVSNLPAIENGGMTFATFNSRAKITDQTIQVWAAILHAIPGARLILKALALADTETRQLLSNRFEIFGIPPGRIAMVGHVPKKDHLSMYQQVDVALDTFPYNGTTTTCEALWMGVPVISLVGDAHVGRVGASILTHVGLDDFIADSAEMYIQKAVFWSRKLPELNTIRQELRDKMRTSPLTDAVFLTRSLETVYYTL